MREFSYTIQDELGIHARPAGALVKEAKKYTSRIMLKKGEKSADASKLMAIMCLGIKCGEQIIVSVEGADEEAAVAGIEAFFKENL